MGVGQASLCAPHVPNTCCVWWSVPPRHRAHAHLFRSVFMFTLFTVELIAFLSTSTQTNVILDTNADTRLRINFNITMMDLSCDYAVVDVYDVLGTNVQNVSKNIEKWQLDENGVKRIFSGRNKAQKEIQHDTHHPDIEELHKNGVHAIPLTEDSFEDFLKEHKFSFVNFYAPWCIWYVEWCICVSSRSVDVGVGVIASHPGTCETHTGARGWSPRGRPSRRNWTPSRALEMRSRWTSRESTA